VHTLAEGTLHVLADEQEGRYSNHFKVGFNSFEFILDFGQAYEGAAVELHHTRIITGPVYAKALAHLLLDSLAAYEDTYGKIPEIAPRDRSDLKKN
jgi:hypothetical protein